MTIEALASDDAVQVLVDARGAVPALSLGGWLCWVLSIVVRVLERLARQAQVDPVSPGQAKTCYHRDVEG